MLDNDLTVYERIKKLRKSLLCITQEEFATTLGVSRSNIGNIEVGRINITNRILQDICTKYSVNEEWLRHGTGEVFVQTPKSVLKELSQAYKLTEMETAIVSAFLELSPEGRSAIIEYIKKAAQNINAPMRDDIISNDIIATEKMIQKRTKKET